MIRRFCGLGLLLILLISSLSAQNNEKITPTLTGVNKIDICGSKSEQEFTVLLTIGEIKRSDSLFGYNFEIKYDPTKIKFKFISTIGTLSEFFEIKQFTILEKDSAIRGTAGHLNPFLSPVQGNLPLLALLGEWVGKCNDTTELKLSYIEFTDEFKKGLNEPQNLKIWAEVADKPDRKLVAKFIQNELLFNDNNDKIAKMFLSSNGNKVNWIKINLHTNNTLFQIEDIYSNKNENISWIYLNDSTNVLINLLPRENNVEDTLFIRVKNNCAIGYNEGNITISQISINECDCIKNYEYNQLTMISDIPDTTTGINLKDDLVIDYQKNCECFIIRNDNANKMKINIYDIYGRSMYKNLFYDEFIRIDARNFPNAVYFFEIISQDKRMIKNLIKY